MDDKDVRIWFRRKYRFRKGDPKMSDPIRTYTNEGEVVLDNCLGSGTSAIAALESKRKFIGFEMDKKYYEIATKRIEEFMKEDL